MQDTLQFLVPDRIHVQLFKQLLCMNCPAGVAHTVPRDPAALVCGGPSGCHRGHPSPAQAGSAAGEVEGEG